MVNYRGPQLMQGLVEKFEIPIFHRVSEISFTVSDLDQIDLSKTDVSHFHALERISISKRGAGSLDESDVRDSAELVPPCRLNKVDKSQKVIHLELGPGSPLSCSSG